MGRYYKNPDPDFVKPEEFLFKPPWEEIKAGMRFVDETIQESEQKEDAITDTLNSVKYNAESTADKALYENLYGQYKGTVEDLQDKVAKNPNDWRNQVSRIRKLSNTLKEDLTKGNFAKMQKRKMDLDNFDATYKTTLDPIVYNQARKYYIEQMNTGLDSGNYDTEFSKEAVMNKRDLNKDFMGYLSQKLGLPNEQSINGYGENGQFMYTKNGSTTSISRESIEKMYRDFLGADAKPYLEYMSRIGVGDYMKDGEINMDNSELQAGMKFMGGYNYSQTKSTVNADYTLGAKTQAANAQTLFAHKLTEASKIADRAAEIEAAKAAAGVGMTQESQYFSSYSALPDLSSSLYREIKNGINNNPNLSPQAREKANHALLQSLSAAAGKGLNIKNLQKLSPQEQQKQISFMFNSMTPQQSREFAESFNSKVATIPSLSDLSGVSLSVAQRANRNFNISKDPNIKFSVGNTAALLGLPGAEGQNLILEKNKDTRTKYSSVGDIMDKKVKIIESTSGKTLATNGKAVAQGVLGDLYDTQGDNESGSKSERIGSSLGTDYNLNLKEGTWVANGLYPAGDPRNVSYMVPGTYKGKKVLIMVENGPGGISFGPTR